MVHKLHILHTAVHVLPHGDAPGDLRKGAHRDIRARVPPSRTTDPSYPGDAPAPPWKAWVRV